METPLFGVISNREQNNGSPEPERTSRSQRCRKMWNNQRDLLLEEMDDKARKLLIEAAAPMGREWISIPTI